MSSSLRKGIFKIFLLSLPGVYSIEDNYTVAMVGLEKKYMYFIFFEEKLEESGRLVSFMCFAKIYAKILFSYTEFHYFNLTSCP